MRLPVFALLLFPLSIIALDHMSEQDCRALSNAWSPSECDLITALQRGSAHIDRPDVTDHCVRTAIKEMLHHKILSDQSVSEPPLYLTYFTPQDLVNSLHIDVRAYKNSNHIQCETSFNTGFSHNLQVDTPSANDIEIKGHVTGYMQLSDAIWKSPLVIPFAINKLLCVFRQRWNYVSHILSHIAEYSQSHDDLQSTINQCCQHADTFLIHPRLARQLRSFLSKEISYRSSLAHAGYTETVQDPRFYDNATTILAKYRRIQHYPESDEFPETINNLKACDMQIDAMTSLLTPAGSISLTKPEHIENVKCGDISSSLLLFYLQVIPKYHNARSQ